MEIDRVTALEILNEAKEAGFEDQPIPDTDEKLIARAEHFHTEAKKLWDNQEDELLKDVDVRRVVQSIIYLGDSPLPEDDKMKTGIQETPDGKRMVYVTPDDKVRETYPRRSSGGLSESDERETDSYPTDKDVQEKVARVNELNNLTTREHLPVPAHIEGDPDQMPRDLSNLVDKEIRRLSGEYNAYLTRATYLLGLESSDLANAEHLLEAARAKALRNLDLTDPLGDGKKQKLAKVIDAELLSDPGVIEWSAAVNKHQQQVIVLKSLKEIYSGNVDRLSREWTMRQNEWEKSRK
jgi:hypothetical protein